MDSPQNHIWGPSLWLILHSIAEKIGTKIIPRIPQEETRLWTNLLSSLRYSLPCPMCKKHYIAYYNSKPIKPINISHIREWLYNLHTLVNIKNNTKYEIKLEQLPEIYSTPFNFSDNFKIFSEHAHRAVRFGWCLGDDVKKTIRALIEIKYFYGLI
jgi:hypothetical protein